MNIVHLMKAVKKYASDVRMSLIENTDPFLKRLSDCKDFEDRIDLCDKEFEKLGTGSARSAYRISEDLILKLAINSKGTAQNLQEMQKDLQTDCVNKIVLGDAQGKFLVMPWTSNITKSQFKNIVGFGFDSFISSLSYTFNNESDDPKPRDYDEIKELPLWKCLAQTVIDENLLLGDFDKTSSFGLNKDGKIVLRDSGFSKVVHSLEYTTHPKSSSSTPDKTSS